MLKWNLSQEIVLRKTADKMNAEIKVYLVYFIDICMEKMTWFANVIPRHGTPPGLKDFNSIASCRR